MTDTITRLMALADEYALRNYHHHAPGHRELTRQALQDGLQKLFTPLSDGQIKSMYHRLCNSVGASYGTMARATEAAHGITGETK